MIGYFLFWTALIITPCKTLLAKETIIEVGQNTYLIENAKFYEFNENIDDPKVGFAQHEFYKKYLNTLKSDNPKFNTTEFNGCLRSELRKDFRDKNGKKFPIIPFLHLR